MFLLGVKLDIEAMALKGYTAFPKATALVEPHQRIV